MLELKNNFGVCEIILPNAEISEKWQAIPTESETEKEIIAPFLGFLLPVKANDFLVIQGEFGATFAITDWALNRGIIALHSATERIAQEFRDGEKVFRNYVFEHKCFRKYERI